MRELSVFLGAFVLLFSNLSVADECTPSQPENPVNEYVQPATVECIGRVCYYLPRIASQSAIFKELEKAVMGSVATAGRLDYYIEEGREHGEVSFWHRCQETLDEMKVRVVQLDQGIGTMGRERIDVRIQILHVSNQALSNFSFGITGLYDGLIDTAPPRGNLTNSNGGFDLNLSFGNLTNHLFNVRFNQSKGTNQAYMAKSIPLDAIEGLDINQSLQREQYREEGGIGDVLVKNTGYSFGGRPYIDPDSGQIILKDFSIFYAVPSEDIQNFGPETLNLHREEIVIPRESPYVIVADDFTVSHTDKARGLPFYLQNSTVVTDSKLLVFISAYPLSNPPAIRKDKATPLSEEELEKLPRRANSDLLLLDESNLRVLKTESQNSVFGLLGFQLNKSGLDETNYDGLVKISLKDSTGAVKETYSKAQYLTTGVFQLPSPYSQTASPATQLELKLEWFVESDRSRGRKKSVTYQLLHIQDAQGEPEVRILKRR